MRDNLVADTDFYKYSHAGFDKEQLTNKYSYCEARLGAKYPETIFFGLDYIIEKHLSKPVTKEDIAEAKRLSVGAFGYDVVNEEVWNKVVELGHLPIEIKAVPEGTAVPVGNVLFTIKSTEDWFAKHVQLLETTLMRVWYPCTIATRSARIKKRLYPLFLESGTPELLDHLVIDFGLRGATTMDAGEIGGMAHLIAFLGTDNARAVRGLLHYYGEDDRTQTGYRSSTVVASEHSIALMYGRNGEKEYVIKMLNAYGDVPVSIVIDSYDPHGLIRNVIADPEIVEMIKSRNSRVILRPDSGIPEVIVMQIIELLSEIFGYARNAKGYKVLNHNIGVIQGDGMDEESIIDLYGVLLKNNWSTDNLAVGSGGGLLQKDATRDTQRFAIKPSYGIIGGKPFNFRKNPSTDPTKVSKSGMLKLHPTYNGSYTTISSADNSEISFNAFVDVLKTVYYNGTIVKNPLNEIIDRVDKFVKSN